MKNPHRISCKAKKRWATWSQAELSTGAPMSVQQELMRHASIQTTMNIYGGAMSEGKRTANDKVVRMAIR